MSTSPARAPRYSIHRTGVKADDVPANVPFGAGANASEYQAAHVQVVPGAGDACTATVLFWSEAAGKFIVGDVAPVVVAAGVAREFSFSVRGRIFFVALSSGTYASPGGIDVMHSASFNA